MIKEEYETQAGFETVLLETRHVKAALSAMTVKTDRKDACGLALARKIGVILHRMWVDGTTYRWTEAKPIATQA